MTTSLAGTNSWRVKLGWSEQVVDICWLACAEPGYLLQIGAYEICLCAAHVNELETSAANGGYSCADPPAGGGARTLIDVETVFEDGVEVERRYYEDWWPWQRIEED